MARGYFDPARVERLVREHLDLERDHARALWTLVQLEVWHRTFLDSADWCESAPTKLKLSA